MKKFGTLTWMYVHKYLSDSQKDLEILKSQSEREREREGGEEEGGGEEDGGELQGEGEQSRWFQKKGEGQLEG